MLICYSNIVRDNRPDVKYRGELGDSCCRELWNWMLRRQGLSEDTKLGSVLAIADSSLGLHSARLPSPFATVLARSAEPSVAFSLFAAETRSHVMTVRCMRKTLHTLPVSLAAIAHAATAHFRERDVLRSIHTSGEDERVIARLVDGLASILESGPLSHRLIESRLVSRARSLKAVRLALKLAWERGIVAYVNEAAGWNREHRTFGLSRLLYPDFRPPADQREAVIRLVDAYFERYGPASLKDVAWWSGLSRRAVARAMRDLDREWIELGTGWADSPLYMRRDLFEEFTNSAADARQTGVNLLAHEDVALKAYFETRRRYLGATPAGAVFNQIGEVLPTIVLDGHVIGTWAWDARSRSVSFRFHKRSISRGVRAAVRRHSEAVSASLRLGWIDRRPALPVQSRRLGVGA